MRRVLTHVLILVAVLFVSQTPAHACIGCDVGQVIRNEHGVMVQDLREEARVEIGNIRTQRIEYVPHSFVKTSVSVTLAPRPRPVTSVTGDSVWDRLAQCESGGNWHINTGNGYGGGIQFSPATWRSVGGSGHPSQASREEQIKRGKILQARSGWGQWPACSRKLGLR